MLKLTPQQRLERAVVRLISEPEFLAYSVVMMVGDTRIEPDPKKCPTAYTDGFNVVFGEKFIETLTDEEFRFVILHETLHKMYRHTVVWQHLFRRSPVLANVAADYVVNGTIVEAINDGASYVKMPKQCLYDKTYSHNMSVGEVFRELLKKYPQADSPQCVVVAGLPDGFDEHDWEAAQGWSPEEQEKIQQQIDSAIRQGNVLAGKVGGKSARDIGELMKVKIDPWALLRQFLRDTCQGDGELSYSRPNRRFLQQDMIMPTEICNTLPHILLIQDTSGSIGGDDLTYGISNLVHCFKTVDPERVTMMYVDTEVAAVEEYERGEVDKMLSSTKPAGGGGTAFQCVSDYLKKNQLQPTVIVFFTDGYTCSWPEDLGIPTVWLIYQNDGCQPPYGSVAYV